MPAERGSGKLPEVTLFLRQLRQHWESQGSDVAASRCASSPCFDAEVGWNSTLW